ncbi:MAG: Riboflavin biosynthesis protein RibF [Candidatus Cloacimonetes bacterium ADurb.Bin088]|jgi:riboflavin kinase/FMN adenylyltransferase|nr:MAG: Riboflavin biosynthesis protein RibF [Candidatus Cloacimonetes bacterium ADurb.Bin088]
MCSVLSIGNFDGVHLGHQRILQRLVDLAKQQGYRSVVLTFDSHPAYILNPEAQPETLTPREEKQYLLTTLGVDKVEFIHFDKRFAQLTAKEFLEEYLIPEFKPRVIVVGYDSHFGHNREGDHEFLARWSGQYGYNLEYIEPVEHEGVPVSSSRIRELLHEGNLQEANSLLGRPYTLLGKVVRGYGRGRALGFPTANMELADPHQLVPRSGVYLSKVQIRQGEFFGLTNIGVSPTLRNDDKTIIETYLLDFSDQIYGSPLAIKLLRYLREERMFQSQAELVAAMEGDLKQVRAMLNEAT